MRILLVEDEKDLSNIMKKRLIQQGYRVDCCYNGSAAMEYMEAGEYDVIVLDIMIPEISGLDLLKNMRRQGNLTKVILVTAKDTVEDRVRGLDYGADDYLVKPFAFEELLARLRVMTRRSAKQATNVFRVENLYVDCESRIVKRDEEVISLSTKEYALLEYMVRNQGVVLSRSQIEQNLWNFDYEGGSNIIDVYIRYLRKKIDEKYEPKLIHTVRGAGYVLRKQP